MAEPRDTKAGDHRPADVGPEPTRPRSAGLPEPADDDPVYEDPAQPDDAVPFTTDVDLSEHEGNPRGGPIS
jgi:hypothetical protein